MLHLYIYYYYIFLQQRIIALNKSARMRETDALLTDKLFIMLATHNTF